jgi:peptidylglycine monooxygenase
MAPDRYVTFAERTYKVERSFLSWPASLRIGASSKGAIDSEQNLYVCQRADPPILVFDRHGKFTRSVGDGRQADSHGIWITRDDRILLVDRDAHQIVCYGKDGTELFAIGDPKRPRFGAPFNHPTDVVESPSGDLYVSDGYANMVVHRFAADGKHKKTWGGFGSGPGQFTTPHGIGALPDGRILVGDRENDRVQVFDPDGNYLTEWHGFYHPMDIHVARDGLIYVSDQRPRVTILNGSGEIVGSSQPALVLPHGITSDQHGNFYIIELSDIRNVTRLAPVR